MVWNHNELQALVWSPLAVIFIMPIMYMNFKYDKVPVLCTLSA